ncbi:hypothetical protein E4U53_003992 [Claviceps sorghi]|nr:hypothetical protein E4U53_003992 [Claviceps sorghi]
MRIQAFALILAGIAAAAPAPILDIPGSGIEATPDTCRADCEASAQNADDFIICFYKCEEIRESKSETTGH